MCVKDELDAKTLLLKLPHSCYIAHGETKLVFIQKFYLYLLVFLVPGSTMHTTGGEK